MLLLSIVSVIFGIITNASGKFMPKYSLGFFDEKESVASDCKAANDVELPHGQNVVPGKKKDQSMSIPTNGNANNSRGENRSSGKCRK